MMVMGLRLMSRSKRISDIMKLEENDPISFVPISRYTKEYLEMQKDDELLRIERMLRHMKEAQNQNA